MRILLLVLGILLAGTVGGAGAHPASTAWVDLEPGAAWVDLAVTDAHRLVGLDADEDGGVSWGEAAARKADLDAALRRGLELRDSRGRPLPLGIGELRTTRRAGIPCLSLRVTYPGEDLPGSIRWSLLFDRDAGHRVLVALPGRPMAVLTPGRRVLERVPGSATGEAAPPAVSAGAPADSPPVPAGGSQVPLPVAMLVLGIVLATVIRLGSARPSRGIG